MLTTKRKVFWIGLFGLLLLSFLTPPTTLAKEEIPVEAAFSSIDQMHQALEQNQLPNAQKSFDSLKKWWKENQTTVRNLSLDAYTQIGQQMGEISIALLNEDSSRADEALQQLQMLLHQIQGGNATSAASGQITLDNYVQTLQQTKSLLENQQWEQAQEQIRLLQQEWLSVEGDVVSQSQSVYNKAETDLALMSAYISSPNERDKTVQIVDEMIFLLKPLTNVQYGLWDAALIPLREGLEALLVIGALLTFTKKTELINAERWVWGGALSGIGASAIIGGLVYLLLSSAAFGDQNMLINGCSGILASLMLLYVSYWLHRNSNIGRWNQLIATKSQKALSTGSMLSLALIAFLAILREGLESVLFLIGMAGRMSPVALFGGIALGIGALIVLGFLMIRIGVRLPLKPFFLLSSLFVFYLCLKFMGDGIHSLQLAGFLPSTVEQGLPTLPFLSVYPSWYSTLPQGLLLVCGLVLLLRNQYKTRKRAKEKVEEVS